MPPHDAPTNPYESPKSVSVETRQQYYLVPDPRITWRLTIPANALLVCAGLQLLPVVPLLLRLASEVIGWSQRGFVYFPSHSFRDGGIVFLAIAPGALLVFCGSYQMTRLRSLWLCRAAAIVACIPFASPLVVLAIPFGIWATIVLFQRSTAAEFERIRLPVAGVDQIAHDT